MEGEVSAAGAWLLVMVLALALCVALIRLATERMERDFERRQLQGELRRVKGMMEMGRHPKEKACRKQPPHTANDRWKLRWN
jgi:hypothetical protein